MAISKIQFKASAQATPVVWMDVTQKTVTAGTMLNGTTALKNDGTDITGNIVSKTSSDLTANVLTVTAPAGHYASAATKTLTDQYLLAENIKKDISIFGVTGTYEGGGGGSTGLEYEEGTWTPASDVSRGEVFFAKAHSDMPAYIVLAEYNNAAINITNYTNQTFIYADMLKLFGDAIHYGNTGNAFRYSVVQFGRCANNQFGVYGTSTTYSSENAGDTDTTYARYWAAEDRFYPYSNSTSYYWRAGMTYKWLAVWAPAT